MNWQASPLHDVLSALMRPLTLRPNETSDEEGEAFVPTQAMPWPLEPASTEQTSTRQTLLGKSGDHPR